MNQEEEQLVKQVEDLFENRKSEEIISLLTDELLTKYNSATLYAYNSRAFNRLNQPEECLKFAQKAIDIDPQLAMGYYARGNAWLEKKEYDKAISDFNKALEINNKYTDAINGMGVILGRQKKNDLALQQFNKAIEIDPNYKLAYDNIGLIYHDQKKYDLALEYFNKAIKIDPKYMFPYYNIGNIYSLQNNYEKALEYYDTAINIDPDFSNSYYNRATTRASIENDINYSALIDDYKKYINLTNNQEDYKTKVALDEIERLERKIKDSHYAEVEQLINRIKELLAYTQRCVTHYTSLSAAKAMVLENSPFRLSEGAFLNDTSEGRALFDYLSFTASKTSKEIIGETFVEKPFIGSFVADTKHNDLTLWRMYGKEERDEAKGCALTLNKDLFVDNIETKLKNSNNPEGVSLSNQQFTFYKVAYRSDGEFFIPGDDTNKAKLNDYLKELKQKLDNIKDGLDLQQKNDINESLNGISYLFKDAEYQYEHEVRLVVRGVGFTKLFTLPTDDTPPKVFIKLVGIVPALTKITLGPKVGKADEWAAYFNYYLKELREEKNEHVEIVISHLPFK